MEFKQEKSPLELEIVWPKYGLKQSPYSTSPMRLLDILPIQKVFCGRKEEVLLLKRIINSTLSTRNLIVGEFGVGKTTFANYVRWDLALKNGENAKYLTNSAEIKVQQNWDAVAFLLSTLSAIYTASIIFDWKGKGIKINSIQKLKEYVSINKLNSYEASLGGFGGGFGQSVSSPPIISPEILESLLQEICKELLEQGKQIIISYDNLENVDSDKMGDIFKAIRDYLQIDGFHSIFMGPPDVISALKANGQVHSVFSRPMILKPLTEMNVIEILERRCESLKIDSGRYIRPYDEVTVKELYNKLNHNIRFTFKVMEDATLSSQINAPCVITMHDIFAVQEKEKKEIMSSLNENQLKIISSLLERPQLSQKELSSATKIGITNLTNPVRELIKRGLITEKWDKNDKRVKYVRLSDNSYLKLFFDIKKMSDKTIQQKLNK